MHSGLSSDRVTCLKATEAPLPPPGCHACCRLATFCSGHFLIALPLARKHGRTKGVGFHHSWPGLNTRWLASAGANPVQAWAWRSSSSSNASLRAVQSCKTTHKPTRTQRTFKWRHNGPLAHVPVAPCCSVFGRFGAACENPTVARRVHWACPTTAPHVDLFVLSCAGMLCPWPTAPQRHTMVWARHPPQRPTHTATTPLAQRSKFKVRHRPDRGSPRTEPVNTIAE